MSTLSEDPPRPMRKDVMCVTVKLRLRCCVPVTQVSVLRFACFAFVDMLLLASSMEIAY